MIPQPARFDPPQMIQEVVLIGAGGTGAQLARSICRIVYDLKRRRKHLPAIWIVDPDRIEGRNVGRQLFTQAEADRGDYKAETLARRFNYSLGLAVEWFNEPFDADKHAGRYSLICGAVDNHLARREIARANCLILDCGNHVDSGQVTLGNTASLDLVSQSIREATYHYLPSFALLFPALLEPAPFPASQPAGSCAELVDVGDQGLLVNDLIAVMAAHYVHKLLNQEPVTSFLSFCDAGSLSVKSIAITPENLRSYLP